MSFSGKNKRDRRHIQGYLRFKKYNLLDRESFLTAHIVTICEQTMLHVTTQQSHQKILYMRAASVSENPNLLLMYSALSTKTN